MLLYEGPSSDDVSTKDKLTGRLSEALVRILHVLRRVCGRLMFPTFQRLTLAQFPKQTQ